jgi:arginase family enzyme
MILLDKSVFSAQDFSVPDGLSKKEFQRTLKVWVKSGKLCGVAIMVFDAGRDPDGSQARRIVELIAGSFAEALK